jgi:hypothetical protein
MKTEAEIKDRLINHIAGYRAAANKGSLSEMVRSEVACWLQRCMTLTWVLTPPVKTPEEVAEAIRKLEALKLKVPDDAYTTEEGRTTQQRIIAACDALGWVLRDEPDAIDLAQFRSTDAQGNQQ